MILEIDIPDEKFEIFKNICQTYNVSYSEGFCKLIDNKISKSSEIVKNLAMGNKKFSVDDINKLEKFVAITEEQLNAIKILIGMMKK